MKLIKRVEISRFRSISEATLEDLGNFSVFVGLNNSGKSNILRALNAFFSDNVEPGQPLQVDTDHYRSAVRYRRKKVISVKISFELPDEFAFRKGLEHIESFLGRQFSITKEWHRDEPLPRVFLNDSENPLDATDREKVSQFLYLISFRYVPNRVLPLEIIRQEHRALRDVLIRRLGRKVEGEGNIFQLIEETSAKLVGHLTPEVKSILSDINSVRLATPKSLTEMIFAFGYRLEQGGVELEDTVQGSGVQSLLMFRTLHLIDRDYFQKFGWRQAAIWALEEPESSLHTSLEANMASFISTVARDPKSRIQVFATTHSDLITQYCDRGYLLTKNDTGSIANAYSPAELLSQASRAGISRWVHPILFSPLEPLLLVEGKNDAQFLTRALTLLGKPGLVRISFLEMLSSGNSTGGVDELRPYVKQHSAAIKSRSRAAPVLVALDWDAASKKTQFEKGFSQDDPYFVLAWDEAESNPNLTRRFRGLERFYSDRLIERAFVNGAEILTTSQGKKTVDPENYESVKQALAQIVESDLQLEDLHFVRPFLQRLEDILTQP